MGKLDQNILCIGSDKLFEKGKWQGIKTTDLDYYYKLLVESSEFRKRADLENENSTDYKQIIPQVILRWNGMYFLHRQVSATETRLNSKCPLPIGGHVEEFDSDSTRDILQTALERELAEEVIINGSVISRTFLGLIYLENKNPVNALHLGLLYIFDLNLNDEKQVYINPAESGLETIGFVSPDYLIANRENLTYWSQVFIDQHLDNL